MNVHSIYAYGEERDTQPDCIAFAIGHDTPENDGLYVHPSIHLSIHAPRPSIRPSVHPIRPHLSAAQVHA